jgi:hypothetical protein
VARLLNELLQRATDREGIEDYFAEERKGPATDDLKRKLREIVG